MHVKGVAFGVPRLPRSH